MGSRIIFNATVPSKPNTLDYLKRIEETTLTSASSIVFAVGSVLNFCAFLERAFHFTRRLSRLGILHVLQSFFDILICIFLFLGLRKVDRGSPLSPQSGFQCNVNSSFAGFWFLLGLRAWTNVYIAANHYYRILASRMENCMAPLPTYVLCSLTSLAFCTTGGLSHYLLFEVDLESGVCFTIWYLQDSISHVRFMIVRLIYLASIVLTYIVPVVVVNEFYSELLEAFTDYDAPNSVMQETSQTVMLDGKLFLWLGLPARTLMIIQLIFINTEWEYFRLYMRILTAVAGSYSVLHPLWRLWLLIVVIFKRWMQTRLYILTHSTKKIIYYLHQINIICSQCLARLDILSSSAMQIQALILNLHNKAVNSLEFFDTFLLRLTTGSRLWTKAGNRW